MDQETYEKAVQIIPAKFLEIQELQSALHINKFHTVGNILACAYKKIVVSGDSFNLGDIDNAVKAPINLFYSEIAPAQNITELTHTVTDYMKVLLPIKIPMVSQWGEEEGLRVNQVAYFLKCEHDKLETSMNHQIRDTICLKTVKRNPLLDVKCSAPIEVTYNFEADSHGGAAGKNNILAILSVLDGSVRSDVANRVACIYMNLKEMQDSLQMKEDLEIPIQDVVELYYADAILGHHINAKDKDSSISFLKKILPAYDKLADMLSFDTQQSANLVKCMLENQKENSFYSCPKKVRGNTDKSVDCSTFKQDVHDFTIIDVNGDISVDTNYSSAF